jgi:hypothetical protein
MGEKVSVLNCTALSLQTFLYKDFSVILAFAHGITRTRSRTRYILLFSLWKGLEGSKQILTRLEWHGMEERKCVLGRLEWVGIKKDGFGPT